MAKTGRPTVIKLHRAYAGHAAGEVVKHFGHGVCDALVNRGVAEWHKERKLRGRPPRRNIKGDDRANQRAADAG